LDGLAWFNRMTHIDPMWKVLLTTGFCGGLTTFSTFSAEVVFFCRKDVLAGLCSTWPLTCSDHLR
jgi:protein CrcB